MRLLHLIATLNPKAGGPSNSVRRIVATYPEIGSQGEVLTLDAPTAPFLQAIDITVHALGPVNNTYGYTPRLMPWLLAHRSHFDGVIVHGLWQYLGYAVRHTLTGNTPYMVFTHGMLDPYFKRAGPLKHLKKTLYWWLNEYWLLRRAHFVLFTSAAESQLARKSFWPHHWTPRIVPYGASACPGDPSRLRAAFLEQHPALHAPTVSSTADNRSAANGSRSTGQGASSSSEAPTAARPFILFLSRIHPKKGCDLLLEAFRHIAAQHPDLHLVFAGPDPHHLAPGLARQAQAAGLSDRVHLLGMLTGDQKWGAFSACTVFALPSHQENFGIAVAEALACAKPVLLSDKVNIWQEIVADGAGLAAPDDAPGTLATLSQWLALSPQQQAEMGIHALACFERRYDMRANALGILKIFAELTPPA